jgi:N-methylhydantoinase A
LADLRLRFDQAHLQGYGHAAPGAQVEVVSFRLTAWGRVPRAPLPEHPDATGPVQAALKERRPAYFASLASYVDCPVYDRARLAPGHAFAGPAIVEQLDATPVLRPQQRLLVDRFGNFVITQGTEQEHG